MHRQKHAIPIAVALVLIAAAVWGVEAASTTALTTRHALPVQPLSVSPSPAMAAAGQRLAHIDGCFGCHGDQLTGQVISTDWLGTRIVAPNLTRLARLQSDAQLATAIRYGIKPGGTSVIAMPSHSLIKSSDSDIAAVIAYLRTLPQKPGTAGPTRWGFGGRARLALGLLPPEAGLVNVSARGPLQTPTAPAALGPYLTQAHCSACHGNDLSGKTMEGSPDLRVSIEHYSPENFAHFFQTGQGQIGHGTKTMTAMIRSRFHYFTPAEVGAIYAYLKAGSQPN